MSDQLVSSENSGPRLDYVTCASPAGLHRMAYWEWGDPGNDNVVLCVHGLTRSGRDFDPLAQRLSANFRVVCPDVVGRGKSDWLIDASYYGVPQYASDMLTLIARLRPARLHWVGTSMGGLIAMGLMGALSMSAALRPDRGRHGLDKDQDLTLSKVVLNDIGPVLDMTGLGRIADYVGEPQSFETFDEAVDYLRITSAEFGDHDLAGWQALTRNVFTEQDGRWGKHYDLRIAEPIAKETPETVKASEALLWPAFQAFQAPVLIVRGEHSDLLTPETTRQMLERNAQSRLVTVPNVGHAPTLRTDDQISPIEQFLLESE